MAGEALSHRVPAASPKKMKAAPCGAAPFNSAGRPTILGRRLAYSLSLCSAPYFLTE